MKRHTIYAKERAELAMRYLSKEADEYYAGTSPLDVYEYEDEDGVKRYDVTGANEASGLTFEELDELFRDSRAAVLEGMKEWEDEDEDDKED